MVQDEANEYEPKLKDMNTHFNGTKQQQNKMEIVVTTRKLKKNWRREAYLKKP